MPGEVCGSRRSCGLSIGVAAGAVVLVGDIAAAITVRLEIEGLLQ